jgi:hypothetical protein
VAGVNGPASRGSESLRAFRYRAVVETPSGLTARDFDGKTGRGVLVTDSILKAVAEAEGFNADECELVMVTRLEDGKVLYEA